VARLIARTLAFEAQTRRNGIPGTAAMIDAYRERIGSLGIQPGGGNVHFCVSPDENSDNLSWALASLHHGHALVLAAEWRPEQMLRAIERYRVITVFLDGHQASDLLLLEDKVRGRFDISSVRHLILDLQGHPAGLYSDLQDWFVLPRTG
jgi:long-chain acyl-CoA synthetase